MVSPNSEQLFDLLSYGRRGLDRRDHLSPADIRQVARTVGRTPEVMVKVLSRGATDVKAVRKHLEYIGRKGDVDLETDTGDAGQDPTQLLDDWGLELDEWRTASSLAATDRKATPRLVHKVLFSMPAGTPPGKVLSAVQNFCREKFGLRHRYVMALHTDEPHPHVHVVIKAMSEQGVRLNIRKGMLRQWRSDFARHLREVEVQANATDRYIRGETSSRKSDGIYRASQRGKSIHMRARAEAVVRDLASGKLQAEAGKADMLRTRSSVREAWIAVGDILLRQRQPELARQVRQFQERMTPVMTEKEVIAAQLLKHVRRIEERDRGLPTR
jgi:hypothetical protein